MLPLVIEPVGTDGGLWYFCTYLYCVQCPVRQTSVAGYERCLTAAYTDATASDMFLAREAVLVDPKALNAATITL